MKREYDVSNAKASPYAKQLKKSITTRLDERTIAYFQGLAAEREVPY